MLLLLCGGVTPPLSAPYGFPGIITAIRDADLRGSAIIGSMASTWDDATAWDASTVSWDGTLTFRGVPQTADNIRITEVH